MLKLYIIFFALIKLGLGLLDPVSVSWLFFVHPKTRFSSPISTFDKTKCSANQEFQGCHGTLIHKGVVLVTKVCLLEQGLFGAKPLPYLITKGMFDDADSDQENFEIGHEQYQILPFKFNDNKWRHLPELVMLRSRQTVQAEPLQIADFVPLAEDLNNDCRIYGWANWGLSWTGEPNEPTYQMFSTPVQIIDNKHCSGFEHDLCIDNSDENICPQVSSPYLEQYLSPYIEQYFKVHILNSTLSPYLEQNLKSIF